MFFFIVKKDSIESRREREKEKKQIDYDSEKFSPSSALASQNFSLFSLIFSHFHPFDLLCFELANNSYSLLLVEREMSLEFFYFFLLKEQFEK